MTKRIINISSLFLMVDPKTLRHQQRLKSRRKQDMIKYSTDGMTVPTNMRLVGTRTPGAPEDQGNTWVVTRTLPGEGARKPTEEVLTGDNEWTPRWKWQEAITARQNGTATPEKTDYWKMGTGKQIRRRKMDKVTDYYTGFEGEPEIQFIRFLKNGDKIILRMWYGYFYNIMNAVLDAVEPGPKGWTGLAYYFSAVEGWYDESPWKIQDVQGAMEQFQNVDSTTLDKSTAKVLNEIFELLAGSQIEDDVVKIVYD